MKYNPDIHHRQSIRLKGYDYSQPGIYFITICTQARDNVFGEVIGGKMILNDVGRIIEEEWMKSSVIRKNIKLDEFIIMPDHFHGIIMINENCIPRRGDSVNRPDTPVNHPLIDFPSVNHTKCDCDGIKNEYDGTKNIKSTPHTLISGTIGSIIGQFKSITTKQINQLDKLSIFPIWQRNYYDEIIRNEKQLNETREYIINNPIEWEMEKKKIK